MLLTIHLIRFKTKIQRAAVYYVLNRSSFSGATLSGGMSPQHPRFTFTSIERLRNYFNPNVSVEKADFKILHAESRSGLFEYANPLKEIFESFITFKKRFFTNLINLPYAAVVTYLNTGDSISVVGKKI